MLTEEGRVLVGRTQVIFDEVKQAIKEIEHLTEIRYRREGIPLNAETLAGCSGGCCGVAAGSRPNNTARGPRRIANNGRVRRIGVFRREEMV